MYAGENELSSGLPATPHTLLHGRCIDLGPSLFCCMQVAVHAMQAALNATATSALAMRLTKEALHRSANEETDELISVLSQVGQSLKQ